MHLLLKFRYYSSFGKDKSNQTISKHLELLNQKGRTWWGIGNNTISPENASILKEQIKENKNTFVFLYATQVPLSVHSDGNLWYRAKLLDVSLGRPTSIDLIPDYYREEEESCYFLLTAIEPIQFSQKSTPKVPGQSVVRYVTFEKHPDPLGLISYAEPRKPICNALTQTASEIESTDLVVESPAAIAPDSQRIDSNSVLLRLVDAQEEIIQLKDQVVELKKYQTYYNTVLAAGNLFSSEAFFESWLEENIHKICPELEILDRQVTISWPDGKSGRLDLLAMNKETKDVVIVEVKTKKRSKNSGYDQFLRYMTWARQNKKVLVEKYGLKG